MKRPLLSLLLVTIAALLALSYVVRESDNEPALRAFLRAMARHRDGGSVAK
jgi:hypothetical protein